MAAFIPHPTKDNDDQFAIVLRLDVSDFDRFGDSRHQGKPSIKSTSRNLLRGTTGK